MQAIKKLKEARKNYELAKIKEELNGYDYENTIDRLTAYGILEGLHEGIIEGFKHAIYLLDREEFTEHAEILRAQFTDLQNDLQQTINEWDSEGLGGVSLELLQPSGGIHIAGMLNGSRVSRVFYDMSQREAIELFIENMKELIK